jgi:hypothetical protein
MAAKMGPEARPSDVRFAEYVNSLDPCAARVAKPSDQNRLIQDRRETVEPG